MAQNAKGLPRSSKTRPDMLKVCCAQRGSPPRYKRQQPTKKRKRVEKGMHMRNSGVNRDKEKGAGETTAGDKPIQTPRIIPKIRGLFFRNTAPLLQKVAKDTTKKPFFAVSFLGGRDTGATELFLLRYGE